jgi:hypothetical protein
MNYPWHYRKPKKDKSARCTSIPVTAEMNAKYRAAIEIKEQKQRVEMQRFRVTIDNPPSLRGESQ